MSSNEETDQIVKSVLERHAAVVLDFTRESFDFFKYNGKTKLGPKALKNKGAYWTCVKLHKAYPNRDEMTELFVACALHDKFWVGSLTDENSKKHLVEYRKTNQSIGYTFSNEITDMYDACKFPFKVMNAAELPEILSRLISGKISFQSASILDKYVGYSSLLDSTLGKDHIVWSEYRMKVKRLHRHLTVDNNTIKKVLNNLLSTVKEEKS